MATYVYNPQPAGYPQAYLVKGQQVKQKSGTLVTLLRGTSVKSERSKYEGWMLRLIRSRHGVGRPCSKTH